MLIVKTTNPLKEKAIKMVSNMSNEKIEESIDIIKLLDNPALTNEDIKSLKWYILGHLKGKLESDK